jgi:hypothetical protein
VDDTALAVAARDEETRAAMMAVAPGVLGRPIEGREKPLYVSDLLAADRIRTLGDWGHETDRVRT